MEKVMPLSSLRLLAPSLRVMQAVMWKVVHQRNTKHYGKVERFVSLVTEAIPDILTDRQIRLLTLGLRAKMILHTVCSEQSKDLVQTHLDGLLLTCTKQTLPEQGALEVNFVRLVEGLLKDPKEREHFLENVFPVEYGPNFDTALESLVYLFFARLEELVLIPNFKQIAAWIGDASSVLDEYIECLTSTQDLSVLLRSKEHHGNVAKMDSSAPSPSEQQLFSSLLLRTPLSATNTKDLESNAQNQPGANGFQDTSDREDNDSQQSLNSSDADQTTEEMCNDVAPDVPTMEENNERASSKSAVTPLMSSSATWHPRQRVAHKCTHCGKCFIYRWELLVHQRLHTGETPYTCSQCGKVFRRTSGLCHHRRTRCKNAAYICIKCRGSFQSIQDRHRHKCVQEFVCSHCGKSFKQNYLLVKHEQTHTQDSIFRCRHCGESFSCVAFLAAHKLQHKQQQTKVCVHCGKAFRSKTDLNMHVRRHTDEKPFHCTHCGKRFSNSGNLNMHIQIHTRKIKSYMCTDCGKVFISESRLQVHRRSHTGERPFECTHCGKLFSMAGNLTVHIRLHTGEKPYLCADCGKGFVSAGELQIHRRSHTGEKPYKCTICDRRFIKASKVTVHMRVHTGERPYVCTECGKGFSRGSELNKHAMKHTGVRPYACRFCAKTYTRSNHLKTHLKTHSVIKSQSV